VAVLSSASRFSGMSGWVLTGPIRYTGHANFKAAASGTKAGDLFMAAVAPASVAPDLPDSNPAGVMVAACATPGNRKSEFKISVLADCRQCPGRIFRCHGLKNREVSRSPQSAQGAAAVVAAADASDPNRRRNSTVRGSRKARTTTWLRLGAPTCDPRRAVVSRAPAARPWQSLAGQRRPAGTG
jgi:hypothetical protein